MSVFDVSTALAGLRHTSPQHVVRTLQEARRRWPATSCCT